MATKWFPAHTIAEHNRLDGYDFNRKYKGLKYAVFNFTQPHPYPYRDPLFENQWWEQDEWLLEATDPRRCLYLPMQEDAQWPSLDKLHDLMYSTKTKFTVFRVTIICGPSHPAVKRITEQEALRSALDNSQARWCTVENRIHTMMFYFDSTETAMLAKLAAEDQLRSVDVENYRSLFGKA